jgi:6-phosphogluconolactonase/glucosamine-6-phosphate isomerase/deaminase
MIDYIYTNQPIGVAAESVAKTVKNHLIKDERVLLLLSGGSGITIAIKVSQKLQGINLSKLYISLTDERYGKIGHKDENWQQLIDAGFKLTDTNLYRPLINKNIQETTTEFNVWLSSQLKLADYKIAIFGIGSDGHTAGIKPYSSAVSSPDNIMSFIGDDFERITMTFNAIKQLDEAVIQVSDNSKQSIIHSLISSELPLNEQPAQILKTIPRATLYTNIKGE